MAITVIICFISPQNIPLRILTDSTKFLLETLIKRPLGRPRRRWVDNIKTDIQEVGCGYMDWIWVGPG